jgi:hypothetical protein
VSWRRFVSNNINNNNNKIILVCCVIIQIAKYAHQTNKKLLMTMIKVYDTTKMYEEVEV